jgi:hypothetical protein
LPVLAVAADLDVVEHGHAGEQRQVLEGAADAQAGTRWRGTVSSGWPSKVMRPSRSRTGATGS